MSRAYEPVVAVREELERPLPGHATKSILPQLGAEAIENALQGSRGGR